MRKTPLLLTILVLASSLILVGGIFSKSYSIKAKGKLKKIGINVFWESECINPIVEIDWGSLEPGESKDVDVYVRSESNIEGVLSLDTDLWLPPEAENEITLSWNYDDTILLEDEVRHLILTLVIDDTPTVTDFSFDIIMTIMAV